MTTMLQLEPPIPLLTPKGPALAVVLLDYGAEHHLMWVCIQDATGEIWTWPNTKIRATANPTMGRPSVQPPGLENDTNSKNNLDKQREVSRTDISIEALRRLRDNVLYGDLGRFIGGDSDVEGHGDSMHQGLEGDGLFGGGKTVRKDRRR